MVIEQFGNFSKNKLFDCEPKKNRKRKREGEDYLDPHVQELFNQPFHPVDTGDTAFSDL